LLSVNYRIALHYFGALCTQTVPIRKMLIELAACVHHIIFADNVVSVKHRAGFVPTDRHHDLFGNEAADAVAHERTSGVM